MDLQNDADELYDEFGNYLGPEVGHGSDSEDSQSDNTSEDRLR